MKLLENLKRFFSGSSNKALFDIDANTTVNSQKTNTSGTGQTGKIKNRGTVEINNSTNYTFVLNIPPNGQVPDEVKQLLKQQFNAGKVQFISETSDQEIENYKKLEKYSDSSHIIEFFQDKISSEDLYFLKTGLYIRELSKTDEEQALKIRDRAAIRGKRAKHIIQIAIAGHFENYFMPFFENELEEALQEYNEIIEFLPEFILVQDHMTKNDIIAEVTNKLAQKEKYHLQINQIAINGINKSATTIIESYPSLKQQYPNSEISLSTSDDNELKKAKIIISLV